VRTALAESRDRRGHALAMRWQSLARRGLLQIAAAEAAAAAAAAASCGTIQARWRGDTVIRD
jgi:hypothetical protein